MIATMDPGGFTVFGEAPLSPELLTDHFNWAQQKVLTPLGADTTQNLNTQFSLEPNPDQPVETRFSILALNEIIKNHNLDPEMFRLAIMTAGSGKDRLPQFAQEAAVPAGLLIVQVAGICDVDYWPEYADTSNDYSVSIFSQALTPGDSLWVSGDYFRQTGSRIGTRMDAYGVTLYLPEDGDMAPADEDSSPIEVTKFHARFGRKANTVS